MGGKPHVGALAFGEEPEAIPTPEAVARDGHLGGPGLVAQVVDRGRDLGVSHLGRVVLQELRRVEVGVVQIGRGGLAIEQVWSDRQEAGASEAVRKSGKAKRWTAALAGFMDRFGEETLLFVCSRRRNLQFVFEQLDPENVRQVQHGDVGRLLARNVQIDYRYVSNFNLSAL